MEFGTSDFGGNEFNGIRRCGEAVTGYYRSLVLSSPIPPFKYVTFLTPFFPSR